MQDMHMSTGKIIGMFGIIGAILMVVCVFLEWGSIEYTLLGNTNTFGFSGWSLYSDATVTTVLGVDIKISDLDLSNYSYAPLVTLICGVVGIIATALPMFLKNDAANKILGIVSLLLAVVSIVLMVLFMTDLSDSAEVTGIAKIAISASYGVYIGIVGAALMVIGGVADIMKKNA